MGTLLLVVNIALARGVVIENASDTGQEVRFAIDVSGSLSPAEGGSASSMFQLDGVRVFTEVGGECVEVTGDLEIEDIHWDDIEAQHSALFTITVDAPRTLVEFDLHARLRVSQHELWDEDGIERINVSTRGTLSASVVVEVE